MPGPTCRVSAPGGVCGDDAGADVEADVDAVVYADVDADMTSAQMASSATNRPPKMSLATAASGGSLIVLSLGYQDLGFFFFSVFRIYGFYLGFWV